MAGILQHLRSSTLDKRPNPASMVDGQVAINYASGAPGMFFKDSNGALVKVGPVHVGSGAPNASPASGGTAGNSLGEQWLDTSGGTYVFKIWDGSAWRSEAGEFVNVSGDTMTGSLTMGSGATIIFEGATDDGFETVLTVTDPTADRTITLPNVTGTVVTTGDTGSVTSTMILDGTILNADVNTSAAIAGTKISPDFGGQTIVSSGVFSHALGSASAPTVTFTGDTNTGIYSPGADQVAISTNGTGRLFVDNSGNVAVGTNSIGGTFQVNKASATEVLLSQGSSSSYARLKIANDSTNTFELIQRGSAATGGLSLTAPGEILTRGATPLAIFTESAQPIVFGTSNTERMRLDSSGRLGLGTSSPQQILHTTGASDSGFVGPRFQNNNGLTGLAGIELSSDSTYAKAAIAHIRNSINGRGDLVFYNDTNNDAANWATGDEKLRITSAGNVGIGTASPSRNLVVNGADPAIEISAASSGTYTNEGLFFKVDGTDYSQIYNDGALGLVFRGSSGGALRECARIDGAGRLLIGTSSSRVVGNQARTVQIEAAAETGQSIVVNSANQFDAPAFVFGRSRGTSLGSNTVVQSGDVLAYLQFCGADGTDLETRAAEITCVVDGTPGANDMPGRLVFSTTADGASSPTERLRLTAAGLFQSSSIYNTTGGDAANVVVNSAGTVYRSTSSAKYKTDIETLQNQYADAVLELRPVWYRSTCAIDNPTWSYWGFIAEEVAEIDPRLVSWKTSEVTYDEKGSAVVTELEKPEPEGVQYDRFVPHLLNLIKRQKEQIEAMEARLSALEGV